MQEVWLCANCGAVNRSAGTSCYRCEAPQAAPVRGRSSPSTTAEIAARPSYIPAWPIGFLAAALLALQALFQLGVMAAAALLVPSLIAPAKFPVSDVSLGIMRISLAGYVLVSIGSAAVHSIFLALTAFDTSALGGGKPQFGPLRAFFWWIESGLWSLRANLTVWIPLGIGFFALVAFVPQRDSLGVAMEPQQWVLVCLLSAVLVLLFTLFLAISIFGFPTVVLRKPGRLLDDLTQRLTPSAVPSNLAGKWTTSWSIARACELVAPAIYVAWVLIAIAMMALASPAAVSTRLESQANSLNAVGIVALILLAVVGWVANTRSTVLLARITFALSRAQIGGRKRAAERAGASIAAPVYTGAPVYVPRPSAVPQPSVVPGSTVSGPSPVVPRPRWIRTPTELDGHDQDATSWPAEASEPVAPRPYAPPPVAPPAVDTARVVLRPSSNSVSRYGVPDLGVGPGLTNQPAGRQPGEPPQGDLPEGI